MLKRKACLWICLLREVNGQVSRRNFSHIQGVYGRDKDVGFRKRVCRPTRMVRTYKASGRVEVVS